MKQDEAELVEQAARRIAGRVFDRWDAEQRYLGQIVETEAAPVIAQALRDAAAREREETQGRLCPEDVGIDEYVAYLRQRAERAWQPIETAPIGGLDNPIQVLLWVVGGDTNDPSGGGCAAFGYCYRKGDGSVRGVPSGFRGFECSHWMPLPGQPLTEASEKGEKARGKE